MNQKRVVAINDISCFGRCSLTVALPIISAAGIETAILPTALLSTHLDCFPGYSNLDLSNEMIKIKNHWKSFDLSFDAIYTGYLGDIAQVQITSEFIDEFNGNNTMVIVDPVMGDRGEFYATYNINYVQSMKELCIKADVITPNITEACFILNEEYQGTLHSKEYITNLLKKLSQLGPRIVVLTSVSFNKDEIGVAAYDREKDEVYYSFNKKIHVPYAGTGDIFTSVLSTTLLSDFNLQESIDIATKFVFDTIIRTDHEGRDYRYGLNFEEGLSDLATKIKNKK